MKIAVIAYSCEPNRGSEPGVAWDFIEEMHRRGHELVVFTKSDKKEIIERARLYDKVEFHFVGSPDISQKKRFVPLRILHYYFWNLCCIVYFHRRFSASDFDLAHHVTFVNDWTPSAGAFLGVPFVLGPVGRHPNLPIKYVLSLRYKDALKEVARRVLRGAAGAVGIFANLTHRRAKTIFIINEESRKYKYQHKTIELPAVAINIEQHSRLTKISSNSDTFKLYWAGNFVYWKSPEIAIRAFLKAKEQAEKLELHMFGEGGDFRRISESHQAVDGLFFHGRLEQNSFFKMTIDMDAFLYPSFEGGGMVVLEAMAEGKPVLGLRFGGMSQFVTEDSGRVVGFENVSEVVDALSKHIVSLVDDPELYSHLSKGAKKRAEYFSIQRKCDVIERFAYHDLSERNTATKSMVNDD